MYTVIKYDIMERGFVHRDAPWAFKRSKAEKDEIRECRSSDFFGGEDMKDLTARFVHEQTRNIDLI